MNRKITFIACLVVVMFSACSKDEPETGPYVVAEFANSIDQSVIFQAENRVYVNTVRSSGVDLVTDVYRVDLLNGKKTLILSTDGYSEYFIVSADEKFISIGIYVGSPSGVSANRLELFDLTTGTKTVLKTTESYIVPISFDVENKTLLYSLYEDNVGNNTRKIDLASGTDELISDAPSEIEIAVHPITMDILMRAADGSYFFMDWDGNVVGEPITGFAPQFFTPDGEKIIGSNSTTVIVDGQSEYYADVILYSIATGEVEVLTDTKRQYYAASMSPDKNFVLCIAHDKRLQFSYDLYVVNTESLEQKRLMATPREEWGIGFFDDGRQVLFKAAEDDSKNLYGIKVD